MPQTLSFSTSSSADRKSNPYVSASQTVGGEIWYFNVDRFYILRFCFIASLIFGRLVFRNLSSYHVEL